MNNYSIGYKPREMMSLYRADIADMEKVCIDGPKTLPLTWGQSAPILAALAQGCPSTHPYLCRHGAVSPTAPEYLSCCSEPVTIQEGVTGGSVQCVKKGETPPGPNILPGCATPGSSITDEARCKKCGHNWVLGRCIPVAREDEKSFIFNKYVVPIGIVVSVALIGIFLYNRSKKGK
jgi:hypothetical protein